MLHDCHYHRDTICNHMDSINGVVTCCDRILVMGGVMKPPATVAKMSVD